MATTTDLLEAARAISADQQHRRISRSNSFASSQNSSRYSSPTSSTDLLPPIGDMPPPLTTFQKTSFAGGHILNDMAASLWFTYLLVYLETTKKLSPVQAGVVMLAGQIADGLATPLMGLLSDALHGQYYEVPILNIKCCSRTLVHFISSLFVVVCFSGVWIVTPETTSIIYYATAASLFNVGWAGVQVTHLALIPDIATDATDRVHLTSYRYSATIFSNLVAYVSYLLLLTYVAPVDSDSQNKWRILGLIALGIGGTTSLVFWFGMSQIANINCDRASRAAKSMYDAAQLEDEDQDEMIRAALLPPSGGGYDAIPYQDEPQPPQVAACSYFAMPRFYLTAIVYMCTRLLINIIMVYIAFYLLRTLDAHTTSIATIPCAMYVAGFGATLVLGQRVNGMVGRRWAYVISCGIVCCGCALAYMIQNPDLGAWSFPHEVIFACAMLFGVGTSLLMVTGVSFVNDLVGENLGTSAFVYGCMSFTDKLLTGAVVILVQNHRDDVCQETDECHDCDNSECGEFVRLVMCGVPVLSCIVACAALPFLPPVEEKKGDKL